MSRLTHEFLRLMEAPLAGVSVKSLSVNRQVLFTIAHAARRVFTRTTIAGAAEVVRTETVSHALLIMQPISEITRVQVPGFIQPLSAVVTDAYITISLLWILRHSGSKLPGYVVQATLLCVSVHITHYPAQYGRYHISTHALLR